MAEGNGLDQETSENAEQFVVNAQYIKDLSFENPQPLEGLMKQEEAPSTTVAVEVSSKKLLENSFEVSLKIKAHVQRKDQTIYLIELDYAALVTLKNVPEEYVKFLLFVETPRFLFPFSRHLIATLTQESGFIPLVLKPIDFANLLQRRLEQEEGESSEGPVEGNA